MARSILVIDDNSTLLRVLCRYLSGAGFRVSGAGDARTAWRSIASETPDLLVMDLGLPDCDGLEFLQYLRCSHPQLTVVVITANDTPERRERARRLGVAGFLPKPFPLADLQSMLLQSHLQPAQTFMDCAAA